MNKQQAMLVCMMARADDWDIQPGPGKDECVIEWDHTIEQVCVDAILLCDWAEYVREMPEGVFNKHDANSVGYQVEEIIRPYNLQATVSASGVKISGPDGTEITL